MSALYTNPSNLINSLIYSFNGTSYFPVTDFINPGFGYWLKSSAPGNLILDRNSSNNNSKQINLSLLDKFKIADADGNNQILYVSNVDIDSTFIFLDTEMPPLFSELVFDSRFESEELIKKISSQNGSIDLNVLVKASAFPISLSWELNPDNGIQYSFVGDSSFGKVSSINNTGMMKFSNLPDNKIKFKAEVNKLSYFSNIPKDYNLSQCYPNPFNPSTTIKYALKTDGMISLKVYNAIGEEIRTLINEYKSAGNYETEFNAGNLPSGVYIYRLQSGNFIDSKKMIILK